MSDGLGRLRRLAGGAWPYHAAAFALPLAVYVMTLAPTVYGLDSAELTTGAWTLGIVHSPGCPLYLLLGRVFCLLPFGDVGFRVNLMSAVSASLCIAFLNATLQRLTGSRWLSLMSALILAFSYYFWVWALVAELYALHLCLVSALLLLATRWRQRPSRRLLWLGALLFGVSMGNHLSLVLLLPGFAWLVMSHRSRPFRPRAEDAVPALLLLLGFGLIYLYLPLRQAAHPPFDCVSDYFPGVDLGTWRGMLWMISGRMFRHLFFAANAAELGAGVTQLVRQVLSNFGLLGAAAAVFGLIRGLRGAGECRAVTVALALMFLGDAAFFLGYGAVDRGWMYSVLYLVCGIWLAVGMAGLSERLHESRRPWLAGLPHAAAAALALRLLTLNYPYADLSRDDSARKTGEDILRRLDPGAVFLGMWEQSPVLQYLQIVEGWRPDVSVVNLVFTGRDVGRGVACRVLRAGVPLYAGSTNVLDDARFRYEIVRENACYEVRLAAE